MNIAQYIDHTVLKNTTQTGDIEKICMEAMQYHFAAVCVPPVYVSLSKKMISHTPVRVATVIGFPFGYHTIAAKVAEVKQAIQQDADELDMVMNLAAFKNKDWNYLEQEIEAVTHLSKDKAVLKVIIESGILTDAEIIQCCEFYKNYAIDFLKTSTGYAEKGATIAAVKLMRQHLPSHIQIKASGGIKTFAFAKELLDAGATRLGCSASVAIVQGQPATTNDY